MHPIGGGEVAAGLRRSVHQHNRFWELLGSLGTDAPGYGLRIRASIEGNSWLIDGNFDRNEDILTVIRGDGVQEIGPILREPI